MEEKEFTTEELNNLVIANKEKRERDCGKELQELLIKHGCIIEAEFVISTRGIIPSIRIIAQ
jgi:hypothetical protein